MRMRRMTMRGKRISGWRSGCDGSSRTNFFCADGFTFGSWIWWASIFFENNGKIVRENESEQRMFRAVFLRHVGLFYEEKCWTLSISKYLIRIIEVIAKSVDTTILDSFLITSSNTSNTEQYRSFKILKHCIPASSMMHIMFHILREIRFLYHFSMLRSNPLQKKVNKSECLSSFLSNLILFVSILYLLQLSYYQTLSS